MIAVDTNVVVRLVTRDDEKQAKAVARLLESHPVFIPKTVLLETEWVLRYCYELKRETVLETFRKLLGLPHLTVEDPQGVNQALSLHEQGLDFADALHLASSGEASKFVTFDRDLVRRAGRIPGISGVTEP